jgi:hypothetical protein
MSINEENKGITTIENVRDQFKKSFEGSHMLTRIMMKAWLNHSESRTKNGNPPFTFNNYVRYMNDADYLEQVKLNVFNVDDIGGKEEVVRFLENRINSY